MKRIVVITGASSGYGKAMAQAFQNEGDIVIPAARGGEKLREVCKQLGLADYVVMDVTKPDDWKRLHEHVISQYGKIDILINNAGGGVAIKPFTEQSIEEIDQSISLNLNGTIYGCREFAPVMQEQRAGMIINVSSVCARHCWPEWSVYAAAKAGVLNFSKGLYVEMRPYNVRVTCLIPAAAKTGFHSAAGLAESQNRLGTKDVAAMAVAVANLPDTVVTEEVTVWGIDQEVNPL